MLKGSRIFEALGGREGTGETHEFSVRPEVWEPICYACLLQLAGKYGGQVSTRAIKG